MARVYQNAAQRLDIELVEQGVRTQEEARATLTQLRQGEVDGILAPRSNSLNIPGFIMEIAAQQKIPAMFSATFFPERGGLASYAPDTYDTGKQAARLVDKILKGANPASSWLVCWCLPVWYCLGNWEASTGFRPAQYDGKGD
jgi:ABC-type uncharacterized transport system substrate-binding protein